MKNLTEQQQEIITLITNEFELINEKKVTESDDIFAYIDSAVNEKKLYAEEMKQRNELYESVIVEKFDAILSRVSNILNRYGYRAEKCHTSDRHNLVDYNKIKIHLGADCQKELYLYTNITWKENICSYANTDIEIYEKYFRVGEIQDADLEKFIANLIITQLKKQIK